MFIAIEGPDKIGKTSAILKLQELFTKENMSSTNAAFPKIIVSVKESPHDSTANISDIDAKNVSISDHVENIASGINSEKESSHDSPADIATSLVLTSDHIENIVNAGNAPIVDRSEIIDVLTSDHADTILRSLRSDMNDETQAHLWIAARIETLRALANHLNNKYDYKIDCGKNFSQLGEVMKSKDVLIIYDRFASSTIAYQGTTEEMRDNIYTMHEMGRIPKPDITFILTASDDIYMKRALSCNKHDQHFSFYEKQSKLLKVFDAYWLMAEGRIKSYSDDVQSISTNLTDPKTVAEIIAGVVIDCIDGNSVWGLDVHNAKIEANAKSSEASATNSIDEKKISEAIFLNAISRLHFNEIQSTEQLPSSTVAAVNTRSRYTKEEEWWK